MDLASVASSRVATPTRRSVLLMLAAAYSAPAYIPTQSFYANVRRVNDQVQKQYQVAHDLVLTAKTASVDFRDVLELRSSGLNFKSPEASIDMHLNRPKYLSELFDFTINRAREEEVIEVAARSLYPAGDLPVAMKLLTDLYHQFRLNPCIYRDTNNDGRPDSYQAPSDQIPVVYARDRSETAIRKMKKVDKKSLKALFDEEIHNAEQLYALMLTVSQRTITSVNATLKERLS